MDDTDEAYDQSYRAKKLKGPATTKLMEAAHAILVPTVFLLQKEGRTRMEAPDGAPRQVALSHSCSNRIVSLSDPPRFTKTWLLPLPKRSHLTHVFDRRATSP